MFYWIVAAFFLITLVLTVLTENIALPLVLGVVFVVVLTILGELFRNSEDADQQGKGASRRCPHCGSPVTMRGNRWECGWCGDHGDVSSLK